MKILYNEYTLEYLDELINILYYKNYFSFEEFAHVYVDTLMEEVRTTIHLKQKRKAPPYFNRYGKNLYYISCQKNKHTTWYFFFTYYSQSDIYFIQFITNNHVAGHLVE